jgi:hypothetical protein
LWKISIAMPTHSLTSDVSGTGWVVRSFQQVWGHMRSAQFRRVGHVPAVVKHLGHATTVVIDPEILTLPRTKSSETSEDALRTYSTTALAAWSLYRRRCRLFRIVSGVCECSQSLPNGLTPQDKTYPYFLHVDFHNCNYPAARSPISSFDLHTKHYSPSSRRPTVNMAVESDTCPTTGLYVKRDSLWD